MGKINVGRLILGGIVAGVVADLLDYLVDNLWLGQKWAVEMSLLGHDTFSTQYRGSGSICLELPADSSPSGSTLGSGRASARD